MDKNNNISERISDDNTSRNFRLLSGFSKEEYNEFVSMGRKEYFDDSARILLNHNDETILLLSGEAMLWNGDAPVYKMAGGDSVGEDNVLHAGNGKERFYIEVEPGSEVLRIAKDYIVNFFKDKDQKLFMRYAINIVGSQNLKLRHSYNEITKLYCRIHQTVF